MTGREWIVDAYGCAADALKDREKLDKLFERVVHVLQLHPVSPAQWHLFPETGGLTGYLILEESHLCCHTFPEYGSLCLNLFCCKPRPEFNFVLLLTREFGASHVRVRRLDRPYGTPPQEAA
ncbi:MAG: S-adenosylmethionine decarboxylase [Bryobacteraceae bacterium]|nr:S-adenosylmethionine decarboxylase [Bryobacteraceae bacterium]MDW8379027.1 S-adenosylmethionine decarboxylase [Bryobacterales bacterium]